MSAATTDRGARLGRRDSDQPGAGGEVEHVKAAHVVGMVKDVARQPLAAGPGECPERRRQADFGKLILGLQPQPVRLVGKMQRNLRHMRRRRRAPCWRG